MIDTANHVRAASHSLPYVGVPQPEGPSVHSITKTHKTHCLQRSTKLMVQKLCCLAGTNSNNHAVCEPIKRVHLLYHMRLVFLNSEPRNQIFGMFGTQGEVQTLMLMKVLGGGKPSKSVFELQLACQKCKESNLDSQLG